MESRLDKLFSSAAEAKKVPGIGAIALDKSGKVLFKGVYGSTNLGDPSAAALTSETPVLIWSCTKLLTAVAALQLLEQGKIRLDDPVEKYVSEITKIQVLEGFDSSAGQTQPILRPPKTKATILMLMTHTAGFTYDFFNKDTAQWRIQVGQTPMGYLVVGAMKDFETPLAFDPGTRYEYGVSADWLGFVVEAVSGMPLNEYVDKHILKPLGMDNTGAHVKEGAPTQLALHLRGEDRSLTAAPPVVAAAAPERYGGGHYLYSTLDDFSTFLLTVLNNGTHPVSKKQILKKETVEEYLFKDQIHNICSNSGIGVITTAVPAVSREGELLPGVEKGWSAGLMLNLQDFPKQQKAGSGQWCGLGNLFYWLDPKEGKLGFVMSGILPFLDKEVLQLYDEMERAVYGNDEAGPESNGKGANFSITT